MSFKIQGTRPRGEHTVEIDEYVPLTIQWPGYTLLQQAPRTAVLEAGASLIEIKTDCDSGEMVEFVLVDMGSPEISDDPLCVPDVVETGVPLLSYDESIRNESVSGAHLYSDGLRVSFGHDRVSQTIGASGAAFGFSEMGYLVEFNVLLGRDCAAQLRAVCGLD
ncbi:hypothetical protein ABT258_37710 [Streptomyces tendae]|uniref:hypothetical protein n=1 Tax=Streptomyces tendae TaxID=1932 RepID=UPI0033192033